MNGPALLDAVLSRSTGKDSPVHGNAHWAGVAVAGLTLSEMVPEADPLVVTLFAVFHDSMRRSDGHDPDHGQRGAALARQMRDAGEFDLDEERMCLLEEACIHHDRGRTSPEPTVGACWDADRLNLPRVGRRINPALLSTRAARKLAATRAPHYFYRLAFVWPAILRELDSKTGGLPGSRAYLRFGELPPGGRSSAYLPGLREGGVSAYPGARLDDGTFVLDFGRLLLGIDTRYLSYLLRQARPLYLLEGRQVGIGGMGEPVLEDARIVGEVSPRGVRALPDRPRYRKLLEAWREKREGRDPGYMAFVGQTEADERPVFPYVPRGSGLTLSEMVEERKRGWLARWGLLEGYDKTKAEQKARDAAARPWR